MSEGTKKGDVGKRITPESDTLRQGCLFERVPDQSLAVGSLGDVGDCELARYFGVCVCVLSQDRLSADWPGREAAKETFTAVRCNGMQIVRLSAIVALSHGRAPALSHYCQVCLSLIV